jgi:glycosyltransferase involved in cell wall biosynthesis
MSQKKVKQFKKTIKKEEPKLIKLLFWGDTPDCSTGFGTVSRNILRRLAMTGKYQIDVIGINDRGGYKDPFKHPYRIYPAKIGIDVGYDADFHGRGRLVSAVLGKDPDCKPPWDIVFTLNDPFILEEPVRVFNEGTMTVLKKAQVAFKNSPKVPVDYNFKIVSYWPVDSIIRGNWLEKAINLSDYPVAYTQYCKDEMIKADLSLGTPTKVADRTRIIYHGVNTEDFHPITQEEKDEFREKFFDGRVKKDTFLITVVARNQMRKDLARTLAIFAEFLKRRPDSFLYLNCQDTDAWGSLQEFARNYRILKYGENWVTPSAFNANTGFKIDTLNRIYNVSNCILSTTLGEGFGFYNLEGFATKTAVVAPNNTTHPELFNYDKDEDITNIDNIYTKLRGVPMLSGSTSSEWVSFGNGDLERVRPTTNVADAVKKLIWVYDNPDKVKEIEERAYNWVLDYSWDNVAKEWDKLFTEAYDQLEIEREELIKNPPKLTEVEEKINDKDETSKA